MVKNSRKKIGYEMWSLEIGALANKKAQWMDDLWTGTIFLIS